MEDPAPTSMLQIWPLRFLRYHPNDETMQCTFRLGHVLYSAGELMLIPPRLPPREPSLGEGDRHGAGQYFLPLHTKLEPALETVTAWLSFSAKRLMKCWSILHSAQRFAVFCNSERLQSLSKRGDSILPLLHSSHNGEKAGGWDRSPNACNFSTKKRAKESSPN